MSTKFTCHRRHVLGTMHQSPRILDAQRPLGDEFLVHLLLKFTKQSVGWGETVKKTALPKAKR